jgi:hypothetical protein
MNLKIKIIIRSICSAILASVFLVIAGLATAEDTKSKGKSPEPANADIGKERMERAENDKAAKEKEATKHKKELSDLDAKEYAALHEKFRREREQRQAIEKEKAQKDGDKSSE